jgi:FkbM family methyltransferase
LRYRYQIRRNSFTTGEPEFSILHRLVSPGDFVFDIGANVGHYTKALSELVGPHGRVVAVEPVPTTFSLLAANIDHFDYKNVTLLNVALSNRFDQVGMHVPMGFSRIKNYYRAQITDEAPDVRVLALRLDSLGINRSVRLVKIDAEGHDRAVLEGARDLIERDSPIIIVETDSNVAEEVFELLSALGYTGKKFADSPNTIFSRSWRTLQDLSEILT